MIHKKRRLSFFLLVLSVLNLISCFGLGPGGTVISKPDQITRAFETKETAALRAVARVFSEKKMGADTKIDYENKRVDSDYVVSGQWRTKAAAVVRQINWKECEVTVSVITEKHAEKGWEMRRLLQHPQYDNLFSVIELKIYEEMSRVN